MLELVLETHAVAAAGAITDSDCLALDARQPGRAGGLPRARHPARPRRAGLRRASRGTRLLGHLHHARRWSACCSRRRGCRSWRCGSRARSSPGASRGGRSGSSLGAALGVARRPGARRARCDCRRPTSAPEFSRRRRASPAATLGEERPGSAGLIGTDPGKGAVALVEVGRGAGRRAGSRSTTRTCTSPSCCAPASSAGRSSCGSSARRWPASTAAAGAVNDRAARAHAVGDLLLGGRLPRLDGQLQRLLQPDHPDHVLGPARHRHRDRHALRRAAARSST